jgi:hypothetical protein
VRLPVRPTERYRRAVRRPTVQLIAVGTVKKHLNNWRSVLRLWPTSVLVLIFAQWGGYSRAGAYRGGGDDRRRAIGLLPYRLDRWVAPHMPAALRTLVFPLTYVTLDERARRR